MNIARPCLICNGIEWCCLYCKGKGYVEIPLQRYEKGDNVYNTVARDMYGKGKVVSVSETGYRVAWENARKAQWHEHNELEHR